MGTYFLYLTLVLLIFLLIYSGVTFSLRFAPLKIRILSLTTFGAISFRYIVLLIFLIAGNIKNLYFLKPLILLNLLCIPVLAIITIYICARNDKIKFNYCIIAAILLLIIYIAVIIKLPVIIKVYGSLGYIMCFYNEFLVYGTYLIFNTILFFIAILLLENKTCNRIGMWFILVASFVSAIEIIAITCGILIFPAVLIGDIIWIVSADYALSKLKK